MFLGDTPDCRAGIDTDGKVALRAMRANFQYFGDDMQVLPPKSFPPAANEGTLPALSQSDIYQLGLLFWRIVETRIALPPTLCPDANFRSKENIHSTEHGAYSTQLPRSMDVSRSTSEDYCRLSNRGSAEETSSIAALRDVSKQETRASKHVWQRNHRSSGSFRRTLGFLN